MFANLGLFFARGFGLDTAQTGVMIAAAGLVVVLGSALGGGLSDRVGKRVRAAGAGVLVAASVLEFSLTPATGSVAVAAAPFILWGLGFGSGQAALITLVSELAPNFSQDPGQKWGEKTTANPLDRGKRSKTTSKS